MSGPSLKEAEDRLRELALAFPEAYEEFPWGHRAMKVKGKVFVFISWTRRGSACR